MEHEKTIYPDGQISAKVIPPSQSSVDWFVDSEAIQARRLAVRINSYEDLIYVRSVAEAKQEPYTIDLFIPCLFGQRSDRRFKPNQSFDLKVIAEVINNGKFRRVDILDPHSDVATSRIILQVIHLKETELIGSVIVLAMKLIMLYLVVPSVTEQN